MTQEDADAGLARITTTTDMASFGEADIVIEAATENVDLKLKLFEQIAKAAPSHAILASNTYTAPNLTNRDGSRASGLRFPLQSSQARQTAQSRCCGWRLAVSLKRLALR